jgi:hypothetical protein
MTNDAPDLAHKAFLRERIILMEVSDLDAPVEDAVATCGYAETIHFRGRR